MDFESKSKLANSNKKTPEIFQDIQKWEINRRSFLRSAIVAGAASQITWFTSCSAQLEAANDYLTAEQSTILKAIVMGIFPDDGNGPSADDLNSFGYILWVLADNYKKQEEKEYIIEGLDWANESAKELYFESFVDLSGKQQTALIKEFTEHSWGKSWMSVMVTLVMESALLDPIYGGNTDEAGWNWLDHKAGQPRPSEGTRLESFIETYKPGAKQ